MTSPRPLGEVDADRYSESGVSVDAPTGPPPVAGIPPAPVGPPAGWLGDLLLAWFESRATAGVVDPHVLMAVHADGLLPAAWRDAWTPHRSAAITALEAVMEGWVGLGPPAMPGWRPALLTVFRAVAAIRAAWAAYAAPIGAVRGDRPTLLPVIGRPPAVG